MTDIKTTFDERKQEIADFVGLLKFLEKKEEAMDEDGITDFSVFFKPNNGGISLSYQRLINIMKSNLSLMIYNLIEYTVANLVDSIYEEIRLGGLSYVEINDSIKELWRKSILKSANDPNANLSTFLKKSEEIINMIVSNTTIDLRSRATLPVGNLDGYKIKETIQKHGVSWNCTQFRPDILENFKTQRNNLAHGSVSFVDALRDSTIDAISADANITIVFLEELISLVTSYINAKGYMMQVC